MPWTHPNRASRRGCAYCIVNRCIGAPAGTDIARLILLTCPAATVTAVSVLFSRRLFSQRERGSHASEQRAARTNSRNQSRYLVEGRLIHVAPGLHSTHTRREMHSPGSVVMFEWADR